MKLPQRGQCLQGERFRSLIVALMLCDSSQTAEYQGFAMPITYLASDSETLLVHLLRTFIITNQACQFPQNVERPGYAGLVIHFPEQRQPFFAQRNAFIIPVRVIH